MDLFKTYMRKGHFEALNESDSSKILDQGESDDGFIPVKTDFQNLAKLGISLTDGNGSAVFASLLESFGNRSVIGWFDVENNEMTGMLQIEAKDDESGQIEEAAWSRGAVLRYTDISEFPGFLVFENE